MSLLSNLFGLFFQCLGSLCTFYFIYKIVSVQNILNIKITPAQQESGVCTCVAFVFKDSLLTKTQQTTRQHLHDSYCTGAGH